MAGEGESSGMVNGLYTPEQVELFEQVYPKCQNPNQAQRLKMINEYPYLSDLESNDIKLWFQDRRRHEKKKKWAVEWKVLIDKLSASKRLLLDENDRLTQELLHLENEREFIEHLVQNVPASESESNPDSLEADDNSTRSVLLVEESHTEVVAVSKQDTIGWFPTPRVKALYCIVQLVEEKSGKLAPLRNKESFLLSVCQQSAGGLNGGGRSLMNSATTESLIMAMNSIKKLGTISSFAAATSFPEGILCVKVSLLLKKLDNSNFKIVADEEINAEEEKDMMIEKSTKASVLANWICKSFRTNKGGASCRNQMFRAKNMCGRGHGTSSFRAILFSWLESVSRQGGSLRSYELAISKLSLIKGSQYCYVLSSFLLVDK